MNRSTPTYKELEADMKITNIKLDTAGKQIVDFSLREDVLLDLVIKLLTSLNNPLVFTKAFTGAGEFTIRTVEGQPAFKASGNQAFPAEEYDVLDCTPPKGDK